MLFKTVFLFFVLFYFFTSELNHYEVDGVDVFIEGDIQVDTNFNPEYETDPTNENEQGHANAAHSQYIQPIPWPNGVIPYKFARGFSQSSKKLIIEMLGKIENCSCVQFKHHSSEDTYMQLRQGSNHTPCNSFIGYKNDAGARNMYLHNSCMNENNILHELMHALGFYHEHNRYDRDSFIRIVYSNIKQNASSNFEVRDIIETVIVNFHYDYESVTHYPPYAFAKNISLPTIVSKYGREIKANGLSELDIKKINKFYTCESHKDYPLISHAITSESYSQVTDQTTQGFQRNNGHDIVDEDELFEGDIVGVPRHFLFMNHTNNSSSVNGRNEDNAFRWDYGKWPGGLAPYIISNQFLEVEEYIILLAMQEINKSSCVKFIPRTDEATYINIRNVDGYCQSRLGYENHGPRNLTLHKRCLKKDDVLHELMHALGFYHEHTRVDRDNYIIVNYSNIHINKWKNYNIRTFDNATTLDTEYDFNSILHYKADADAIDKQFPTLIPKIPGVTIKSDGLSRLDKIRLNRLYQCHIASTIAHYYTIASKKDRNDVTNENELMLTTAHGKMTSTSRTCPNGWSYDDHYPHICYKIINDGIVRSWNVANAACSQIMSDATLPIFLHESEYISYSNWWKKTSDECYAYAWLGLIFNITSRTYYWIDGSTPKFSLISTNRLPYSSSGVSHFVSGKWWPVSLDASLSSSTIHSRLICQLRQKGYPLKRHELSYPKNNKCPNNVNWFYDKGSNICYYFDDVKETWHSANSTCVTEIGGSLPFFMTNYEWENFSRLMKELPIHCSAQFHLGYIFQNRVFKTVNGSIAPFVKWMPDTEINFSSLRFVYSMGWRFENRTENWEISRSPPIENFNFICQCRSDNCPHYYTSNIFTTVSPKGRSESELSAQTSQSLSIRTCPNGWTYDDHYPHICYKIVDKRDRSWNDAHVACRQTENGSTLPIFYDESEYISYSNWWKKTSAECYALAWLGLKFRKRTSAECRYFASLGIQCNLSKTYYWIDGTTTSKFSLINMDDLPDTDSGVGHFVTGTWWPKPLNVSISYHPIISSHPIYSTLICQLRLKGQPLKSNELSYPKNTKCPNNVNWFYDKGSDICYYFNGKQKYWRSANRTCVTEIGGSLPFFMTNYEWENFSRLMKELPIHCETEFHLGYICQNGICMTVNGSIAPFVNWIQEVHIYFSSLTFLYSMGWRFENNTAKWKMSESPPIENFNFICQCRSGNCPTSNRN